MLTFSLLSGVAAKFRATAILNTHDVRVVDLDALFEASFAAECAWLDEVRRKWRREAFQARYDDRGVSTPLLRLLFEEFKAAEAVYMEAMAAGDEFLPVSQREPKPVENYEPVQPAPIELSTAA